MGTLYLLSPLWRNWWSVSLPLSQYSVLVQIHGLKQREDDTTHAGSVISEVYFMNLNIPSYINNLFTPAFCNSANSTS